MARNVRDSFIHGFPPGIWWHATKINEQLAECRTHEQVLELMTGVPYECFRAIDEKQGGMNPSYHDGFTLLRQLRNDPDSDLFDRLGPFTPKRG